MNFGIHVSVQYYWTVFYVGSSLSSSCILMSFSNCCWLEINFMLFPKDYLDNMYLSLCDFLINMYCPVFREITSAIFCSQTFNAQSSNWDAKYVLKCPTKQKLKVVWIPGYFHK